MVVGNHDLAAVGVIGIEDFNPYAAAAAAWTQERLSAVTKVWMMSLSQILVHESGFTLTHGSLVDPIWEYLVLSDNAAEHLARQSTPYGLVGHTHLPHVFYDARVDAMSTDIADGTELPLDDLRFVANPGSVGQPRDGDPRAAYAIVDTESARVSFHRVAYDIEATQEKMRGAGLPLFLAERLSRGR
jgi:diadenosine tetraphosphatase ApaH/serine/threonine PP2A family protein phosphatase